jgi:hypothetical protein
MIIALYNPAHLILQLQKIGLKISHNKETNTYTASKKIGENNIELGNFQYFINMIVLQLFPEAEVVRIIREFLKVTEKSIEDEGTQQSIKGKLNIIQYL